MIITLISLTEIDQLPTVTDIKKKARKQKKFFLKFIKVF